MGEVTGGAKIFNQTDWMDGRNVSTLRQQIQAYWAQRGHKNVMVKLVPRKWTLPSGEERTDYDIRSNLVGGNPPRN